jgi:PAS domain S-box-containing protein
MILLPTLLQTVEDSAWDAADRITIIGAVLGAAVYVARTVWSGLRALIRFSANVSKMSEFMNAIGVEQDISIVLGDINNKLAWVDSRSRALLEESYRVAAFETNLEGRCTWSNRTYMDWTGLTANQIKSIGWRQAVCPDYRDQVNEEWENAVEERRSFDYLFSVYDHENDETRWVRCVAYVARDKDGMPLGWIGLMRQVSENRVRSFHGDVD